MIHLGLRKSYRLIFEDTKILRNFQEESGKGAAGPARAFKQLMRSISEVKTIILTKV
jgi:hypothetical protein